MIRRITKSDAILALQPNAQFAVTGDAVTWYTPEIPQPTEAEIDAKLAELDVAAQIEKYRAAVQRHIDATARSREYENGFALAGYVNSSIPPWKSESEAFIAWRDQVWLFVFEKLAHVEAGEVEAPSSPEALIGWIPQIEWL